MRKPRTFDVWCRACERLTPKKIESGLDAKVACGPTATSDVLLFFFPNPLLDFRGFNYASSR
jgi:hypothetical protein